MEVEVEVVLNITASERVRVRVPHHNWWLSGSGAEPDSACSAAVRPVLVSAPWAGWVGETSPLTAAFLLCSVLTPHTSLQSQKSQHCLVCGSQLGPHHHHNYTVIREIVATNMR